MERFYSFFGLHLGEWLYCHTDNLPKTLQWTKIAAVSGQLLANLTKEVLRKMRADQSFNLFDANVARKSEGLVGEPTSPRKRWFLFSTLARLKVGAGATKAIPKLFKITLKGCMMRPLILSSVLTGA